MRRGKPIASNGATTRDAERRGKPQIKKKKGKKKKNLPFFVPGERISAG